MKLWMLFLGAWLILAGLTELLSLSFRYDDEAKGLLAIVAGLLVFVNR